MAMDSAGNRAVRELVFSLDSQPPALSVLWPPAEGLLTNSSPLEVRLLTEVGAVLTINGKQVPVTGPSVTFALNLSEGANAIVVKAYDAAGNGVEVHRTVSFHHAPPELRLQPAPPARTADPFLRLSGVTEPNSTVVINGLGVPVFSDGVFSRVVLLSEGLNRIEVVATDEYGNRANVTYVVEMVPTQPPPHAGPPTLIWALLTLTGLVLAVEAAYLLLRRSRRERAQGGEGKDENEDVRGDEGEG
jgi:bacillopeptidase F